MIRAVVRHSYVKGAKGIARDQAHVNYIQHRPGPDKAKNARKFFDGNKDDIDGAQVKERLKQQDRYGVQMHKLILSPGINDVDLKQYTRETMADIGRRKGLALDWYAVEHRNTAHDHVHVVVMGRDLRGHRVRFENGDHKQLQRLGDQYLEREHRLERYLDKEISQLLGEPVADKDKRLGTQLKKWKFGLSIDDRKGKDLDRDWSEWHEHDRKLRRSFSGDGRLERRVGSKQFHVESGGRLLEFHEQYQIQEAERRLREIAAAQLSPIVQKELAFLRELESELRKDKLRSKDEIEKIVDGYGSKTKVPDPIPNDLTENKETRTPLDDRSLGRNERNRDDFMPGF